MAFARRRVVRHLRDHHSRHGRDGYVLQLDIKGYFAGISHEILLARLSRAVPDARAREFVAHIVGRGGQGLSLRSETSQILAVWLLSGIDHWCKEVLRLRCYARYMDDIYAVHPSRLYLRECMATIRTMLAELGLSVNERKTRVTPLRRGFTFLKVHYTLSESGRVGRRYGRDGARRIRRKLRALGRKGVPPWKVRDEYQSWRKSVKKFDADAAVRSADAAYRKHILKERL